MPTSQINEVIHHLRTVALRDGTDMTDGELLDLFVRLRDDTAIAALVHRHGPMVWGVCRRILSRHHDAEDAFQATFLVLVRKAAAIQNQALLANWLYGVAQQTAMHARASAFKQNARERQVSAMPEPVEAKQVLWDDDQSLFDEELSRLPEKYRMLIVLCDLEGKTRKEAAQQLACPDGTIAGRLARARTMLAKRLARRGVVVAAGTLGVILSSYAAQASAPTALFSSTVQAASMYAAGHATATGVISAKVVALTEGVMKAMLMTKLKIAATLFAIVCVLAIGGGVLHQAVAVAATAPPAVIAPDETQDAAQRQPEQPKDGTLLKGIIGALDVPNRSVTLVTTTFDRKAGQPTETETVLKLTKDAVLLQDGVATKFEDLKRGFTTTVKVDQKNAVAITVDGNTIKGQFKSTNAERNTITVIAGRDMGDKIFHLLKTTKVTGEGGKEGKLQDIRAGSDVVLTLSVLGDNTVIRIQPVQAVEKKKRGER